VADVELGALSVVVDVVLLDELLPVASLLGVDPSGVVVDASADEVGST
jgi:hypothetical protein